MVVLLREGAMELFLDKGDVGDRAGGSAESDGWRLEVRVETLMREGAAVLLLDKPDVGGRGGTLAPDGKAGVVGLRPAVVVLERSMLGRPMGSARNAGTVALLLNPSSSLSWSFS